MTCGVPDTGKDADSCGGFAHQDLWIVDGTTAAARFATAPMPVDEQPMVGSVHGQGRGGPALAGNHRQRPAVHAHDAAAHTAHARQGRAGRRSHPCTAAHDVMSNETKCHMSDLTAACMLLTFALYVTHSIFTPCHTLHPQSLQRLWDVSSSPLGTPYASTSNALEHARELHLRKDRWGC